jgi:hypothetical protein
MPRLMNGKSVSKLSIHSGLQNAEESEVSFRPFSAKQKMHLQLHAFEMSNPKLNGRDPIIGKNLSRSIALSSVFRMRDNVLSSRVSAGIFFIFYLKF